MGQQRWDTRRDGRDRVLLVDAEAASRREFAAEMRGHGVGVVEAASPLEAIDALDRDGGSISTVVIAPTIRSTSQSDLALFIAESYPHLAGVLVRGPHWHARRADHRWLLFDLQGELVDPPEVLFSSSDRDLGRRRRFAQGSGNFPVATSSSDECQVPDVRFGSSTRKQR